MVQSPTWEFDLYVVGETPKARSAYANLTRICSEHVTDNCKITVYNLLNNPQLAVQNQITATPVTVRRLPLPKQTLIGDLSDTQTVIHKLGLK